MSMTVVVTGGRTYGNRARVNGVLGRLHKANPITLLGQGMAFGADMLAQQWARVAGVECRGFQAQWDRRGWAAGVIRNRAMLEAIQPDLVVAFEGGPGTRNCIEQAEEMGFFVYEVRG